MNISTKTTGKEELSIIPVLEKSNLKKMGKRFEHFENKEGKTLLVQGTRQDKLYVSVKENDDSFRKAAGEALKKARSLKYKTVLVNLTGFDERAQATAEGAVLGLYRYEEYKKQKPTNPRVSIKTKETKAVRQGTIIADGVNLVRNLVNRPASDKTPPQMAELAKELGKKYGFSVKVIGQKELEKLGMNAMLGVNRGSAHDAQLALLEIHPEIKEKPIALVGKGVTFDAGGLQIKPDKYMLEMKMDMAGAATVLGTVVTLARLGYTGRVVGAMGLVENLLGPKAYKPKDILKSFSGKTIEVDHTDAEGRLVLADALAYVEKMYKPKKMIDLATLTGAAIFALGLRVAPIMGNDTMLLEEIKNASEETDELVWELPLYGHYKRMMKGEITDLRNIHKVPGMYGPGSITAGAFLSEFVKGHWAHIDIAGTAYSYEKTQYVPEGGTGWGVRLLTHMINK